MYCTRCGQQNPDDSRFCAQCGAQLARPSEMLGAAETTSFIRGGYYHEEPVEQPETGPEGQFGAVDALPPGSALLVVKRGPNAGSRFLLDQPVTSAGRHPDSDIFLDDVTVSRRHAEFRRERGTFAVYDVGSLNGTYVNRQRIDSALLSGGDEVQIGKFRLVFLTGARMTAGEDAAPGGALR